MLLQINQLMKRILGFGFLTLLLYHTLGAVVLSLSVWWQEQHDLTEQVTVYQTVDSITEFQIPLSSLSPDAPGAPTDLTKATEDGFAYHGQYYDVVSVEVHDNILLISGMVNKTASFWHRDLLTFLKDTVATESGAHRKAGQWLKLLLKDYSLNAKTLVRFYLFEILESIRVPNALFTFLTRDLPVYSPPPEV
jgi:hypothetical protein